MLVHLVILKPEDAPGMKRLLDWDKVRPPNSDGMVMGSDGLLCEIDDVDLIAARAFCKVRILASKERKPSQ